MTTHMLAAGAALSAAASLSQAQSPQTIQNASASHVVTIVTVPKPWYAPRSVIASKMRDTQNQYKNLPGLQSKFIS